MATALKSRANPAQNRHAAAYVALPARQAEARVQLGARIPEAKYRQLKLAAVLRGVTVQTLVEHAIQEFLINHPDLLQSGQAPQAPAKSPSRRPR